MNRKRILIVSPIPSHPATQGNSARIQRLGRELQLRGFAADFLYYGMEGLVENQARSMRKFWNDFFFIPSKPLGRQSLPTCWGLDDWCHVSLCDYVQEITELRKYDAVIVNYVWMSKVFEYVKNCVKILDTHDIFGERQAVAEASGLEPRWFFTTTDEEDRGFARADIVVGIQCNETIRIARRFRGRSITVGHSLEPSFLRRTNHANPFFTFGYLGSANPFNIRSIIDLDSHLSGKGHVDWVLAGSISERKLELVSQPFRMGLIDRVEQFYDDVSCVLNPMVGGTGLKIKTVEALAFGAPMIGTADAFDGISTTNEFHACCGVSDVADGIVAFNSSKHLREELKLASLKVFAQYTADVSDQIDVLAGVIFRGS